MTRNTGANGSRKPPPDLSTLEFPVERLTLTQALSLGQEASRALQNQSVELALQMSIRQLQNEWADTKPEETKKRDFLFFELQAVKRVYYSLEGFIAQAQNLASQQNQREAQDYEESQY